MEAKAVAKYIRISPVRVRDVINLIRGKNVNEALAILKFTPNRIRKRTSHITVVVKEKNSI
ncbi:MAG: 50S ribosomal protein L22 [Desulfofundulus kuznetsovii]|nr:MAG: 50S ribosomal protein L22 [Desulfofundulus kuznetsovii]